MQIHAKFVKKKKKFKKIMNKRRIRKSEQVMTSDLSHAVIKTPCGNAASLDIASLQNFFLSRIIK